MKLKQSREEISERMKTHLINYVPSHLDIDSSEFTVK